MPNVAQVLKEEISRLAKKEAKAVVGPLQKQMGDLKKTLRGQRQQIASLQKELGRKPTRVATGQIAPDVSSRMTVRISPASIRKHRTRLGLSQREMGLLLDVSTLTICKWEAGNAVPRGKNRMAIGAFRKLGKRDVNQRLEMLAEAD